MTRVPQFMTAAEQPQVCSCSIRAYDMVPLHLITNSACYLHNVTTHYRSNTLLFTRNATIMTFLHFRIFHSFNLLGIKQENKWRYLRGHISWNSKPLLHAIHPLAHSKFRVKQWRAENFFLLLHRGSQLFLPHPPSATATNKHYWRISCILLAIFDVDFPIPRFGHTIGQRRRVNNIEPAMPLLASSAPWKCKGKQQHNYRLLIKSPFYREKERTSGSVGKSSIALRRAAALAPPVRTNLTNPPCIQLATGVCTIILKAINQWEALVELAFIPSQSV